VRDERLLLDETSPDAFVPGDEQETFPAYVGKPDVILNAACDRARLMAGMDDVSADLGECEAEGKGVLVNEEPRCGGGEAAQAASLRSWRPLS
jgi:hypothetical protein